MIICIITFKKGICRHYSSTFSLILCVMNILVVLCIQSNAHKWLFNDMQLMKIEAMNMSSLILSSLHHTNIFKSYTASLEESVSDFSEFKWEAMISPFLLGMFSLSSLLPHYCIIHYYGHREFDPCISGGHLHISENEYTIQQTVFYTCFVWTGANTKTIYSRKHWAQ